MNLKTLSDSFTRRCFCSSRDLEVLVRGGLLAFLLLLLLEVAGAHHHGGQAGGDHYGQQEQGNQGRKEPKHNFATHFCWKDPNKLASLEDTRSVFI